VSCLLDSRHVDSYCCIQFTQV